MIEPIDIVGQKLELDEDIKRYVQRKVGRLSRFVPRHARKSVKAEVKLRESGKNHGNKYECEVILHLPNETVVAKDSTLNIFAAVDIVEVKLKNQLKKYKETHTARRARVKGLFSRRPAANLEETEQ